MRIGMVSARVGMVCLSAALVGCIDADPIEGNEALALSADSEQQAEEPEEAEEVGAAEAEGAAEASDALMSNSACYPNSLDFALPNKPDIAVSIYTCVESVGYYRRAHLWVRWNGSLGYIGGKRFDSFTVSSRLERYDSIITSKFCDLTGRINSEYSGEFYCDTEWKQSTALNGWSGDGRAVYNKDADGDGEFPWDLHGSPLIP